MLAFLLATIIVLSSGCMPASWGANGLLHPSRRSVASRPLRAVEELDLVGEGVRLRAWWFHAEGRRRGTVVYLHGVADNRGSSVSAADHFVPRGFDVVAYDSRAHGDSTGAACTYGFHEKRDLMRVLDRVEAKPIILVGSSLGAAVALQTAAIDERVAAVVAVATFSDLRTVAFERAPFFASKKNIEDAFAIAEREAAFKVEEVSPVAAARNIECPVFLIHGESDNETPPEHSRRVRAALHSPAKLVIVPHAGHNNAMTASSWREVETWVDAITTPQQPRAGEL